MHEKIMKIAAIYGVILSVVAITGMLLYMRFRAESFLGEALASEAAMSTDDNTKVINDALYKEIEIKINSQEEYLRIPFDVDVLEEMITIETNYLDKSCIVSVEGVNASQMLSDGVKGNENLVRNLYYAKSQNQLIFKLELSDVYECSFLIEDNCICIKMQSPWELYDKIVVVDPGHGGFDYGYVDNGLREKDITLDVAYRLKKILQEAGVQVYLTRDGDVLMDDDKRMQLGNQLHADMFISIHLSEDKKDDGTYGIQTIYNDRYFSFKLNSVELADALERSTAEMVNDKARGLITNSDSEFLLADTTVPAVVVELGYLSNEKESELMKNDMYREKIAEGLCKGIVMAYQILDN